MIGDKHKVEVHEKRAATKQYKQYDIALITLDRNVPTNKMERPICFGDMNIPVKPGDKVSIFDYHSQKSSNQGVVSAKEMTKTSYTSRKECMM